ncbi:MAG: hypothetical protein J7K46_01810 [Bacteroidales bacterium]|nr:hypothetical protein [Bacteroidales bacterium]
MDRLEKIRDWLRDRIKNIKFGRDTVIFLFFLALSTVFWLFNQLSKDTTADFSVRVRFKNDVPDRVILNDLPEHLILQAKGQGYTLMKYKLKPYVKPLEVDLRSFPLRPVESGNNRVFYLLTSYLRGMVNDRMGRSLDVTGIRPDTLYFVFDSLIKRKLPVFPDVKITLARQFIFKEPIHVDPDTVMASGPAALLDTLKSITTKHAEFNEVAESFETLLPVQSLKNVKVTAGKIKIKVEVEQFTEAGFEIPVEEINVPDSVRLFLFPARVKVTFHVGLSRYKKVLPELFTAQVDYKDVAKDRSGKIRVYLVQKPDYIESVRIDPSRVEYLIEKIR